MKRPFGPAGLFASLAILALGPLAGAAAVDPAPTPVPYAVPDMSSMRFLVGTWHCTSMLRGKTRPETDTYKMVDGGMWLAVHSVAPPFDRYRKIAQVGDGGITYNPIKKVWMFLGIDNLGGYGTGTSPGWRGNSFVWTDTESNDYNYGTETLTKAGDNAYTWKVVAKDRRTGKPTPGFTQTCKKSG